MLVCWRRWRTRDHRRHLQRREVWIWVLRVEKRDGRGEGDLIPPPPRRAPPLPALSSVARLRAILAAFFGVFARFWFAGFL